MRPKLTIDQMRKVAQDRAGKCLSEKYINNCTKLKWQCKEGHIWESKVANIRQDRWYPACGALNQAKPKRLGIEKMYDIAKQRRGRFIQATIIDKRLFIFPWTKTQRKNKSSIRYFTKSTRWHTT